MASSDPASSSSSCLAACVAGSLAVAAACSSHPKVDNLHKQHRSQQSWATSASKRVSFKLNLRGGHRSARKTRHANLHDSCIHNLPPPRPRNCPAFCNICNAHRCCLGFDHQPPDPNTTNPHLCYYCLHGIESDASQLHVGESSICYDCQPDEGDSSQASVIELRCQAFQALDSSTHAARSHCTDECTLHSSPSALQSSNSSSPQFFNSHSPQSNSSSPSKFFNAQPEINHDQFFNSHHDQLNYPNQEFFNLQPELSHTSASNSVRRHCTDECTSPRN